MNWKIQGKWNKFEINLWEQVFIFIFQVWANCEPDADHARSGAQNLWEKPDFSAAQILSCKKGKIIRPTSLQSNQ